MSDREEWDRAWVQIQKDYDTGVIDRRQFMKERQYMWNARVQMRGLS